MRILQRWLSKIGVAAFLLAVSLGLMVVRPTQAQSGTQEHRVAVYLFWGDGCPHCAAEKPVLEELAQKYPQIDLRLYEVWYVDENQTHFINMAKAYGFEPSGVPTTFIGDKYWVGYNDDLKAEFEETIQACIQNGCADKGVGIIPGIEAPKEPVAEGGEAQMGGSHVIKVPLLGQIDLDKQSLFVSTLLIAFVDGVNPCSVWVLTMLLALTLHTGSRRKVMIIGVIFLTVTAAVYALFIAGLFTIFTVVSFVGWIQVVVSLVALFFAAVNIKDYFWYKEGLSFTISDDKKPGIFQRMRRIMDASESLPAMAGATVVLAAGVSLVEFSCTAGFPVVWTNMLTTQKVGAGLFVALLLVYMLIYQLDELVIFFTAVYSLKASKLEEKHGRILKLIGGILMLTISIVMLVNPALMNNMTSSLLIFGAAFLVTLLILLVHRTILPRFGIHIGTEFEEKKTGKKRARRSGI